MAWQSLSGMGGGGNGGGNGAGEGAQQQNQPQGTEYTLQGICLSNHLSGAKWVADGYLGVMRFLQTEWHRHERDRNGWEIERQEMKGRIARLEGSTRKADSSNRSLKKYVSMLEKALKERDAQVKQLKAGAEVNLGDSIRDIKEKESSDFKKHRKRRKLHGDSAD